MDKPIGGGGGDGGVGVRVGVHARGAEGRDGVQVEVGARPALGEQSRDVLGGRRRAQGGAAGAAGHAATLTAAGRTSPATSADTYTPCHHHLIPHHPD